MKNNHSRDFWTVERRNQLCKLAAPGMAASEIGALIGTSKLSVLNCCKRRGIDVATHTDAEREIARAVAREANRRKQARWQAKQKAMAVAAPIRVMPGTSRTDPIYRNQLPRLPEMSKNALRAMFAQAVRNTAEMSI
jgi:hypothetical protein